MGWLKDLTHGPARLSNFGLVGLTAHRWSQQAKRYLKGQNTSEPRLNAVQINRSAYGLPVPLVYGKTRIPISLLWYGAFKSIPHTQKQSGGKGAGGKSTSYTYQTAALMGLCEGQIPGIGNYWVDKEKHTSLSDLGLTLFTGAGAQAVWSFLTTNAPTQAIPYDHTAYLAGGAIELGSSAALPNLSVEVKGLQSNATYGDDAVPIAIITDYLTDANHGVGWSFLAGGLTGVGNTYESYCIAMGFFVSPQEMQQRPAVEFLREMLQLTNSDAVWSQGSLRIVPYADAAVTGNGRTYTPDLTPIYSFNDNDYCPRSGEEPVIVTRTSSARAYNKVRVQFLDRAIDYNINIAEATDAQDIRDNGERAMTTIRLDSITDMAVARQVAQLILQRQLYVRAIYQFRVRADYSLLEPMDLVAINETSRGIVNRLVRIVQTDDSESDEFSITAEEMLVGTAGAPRYDTQLAAGYAANYNNAPGAVTTPLIIAAPPQLVDVNGGYELWIAVAGTTPAAWGGCDVYASMDNTTFAYVGTIYGPSRYGTIDATFASGSDPDTTNALQVTLADPSLQLVAGTQADADNLRTLLYVDGEVMAYRYVALDGSGGYTFTSNGLVGGTKYMRRGKYGSAIASHASGTSWMRIDDSIFRLRYDPGQIGQTIYFKFASFNIYGRAKESLGAISSYSKVLSAANAGQSLPGNSTFVARGNCATVGDRLFKAGGSAAWDSDVYSIEAYSGGCAFKCRAAQTNFDISVGLNSDPTTDQNYTSIDFVWTFRGDGKLEIDESGVVIAVFSAEPSYTTSTLVSITYDGITVRYYRDGVLKRESPAPGKVFFLDSSFFQPGAAITDVFFGALNSSPSARLIARGNCVVVGNSIQKQGGSPGWDSDCYSAESFTGGCAVSFRRGAETVGDFMIGLNSDPTTDQHYTSLDYSIESYYASGFKYAIYEGGSTPTGALSGAADDVFAIKHDGQWVRYYRNGVVVREKFDPNPTLFMDSSFYAVGGVALDVNFGPLTSATPSPFIARGNCKVSDNNVIKQGGSTAWDSDCYSIVGYPVCHISFKANDTSHHLMVGLNTDPTSNASYSSIDYAWYCTASSAQLQIYESGSLVAGFGTYSASTVLAVTYDGSTVTYWKDGVSQRTVSVAGLTLFMDSSFNEAGGGINSLRFGPTTNLKVNDTGEIAQNAATKTGIGQYNLVNTTPGFLGTRLSSDGQLVIPGPTFDCTVIVTIAFDAYPNVPGSGLDVYAQCAYSDNNGSSYSYGGRAQLYEADPRTITLHWEFSHSAANAGVNAIADVAFVNTNGSFGRSVVYANIATQIEFVVR